MAKIKTTSDFPVLPHLLVHSDLHLNSASFTLPIPASAATHPTIAVFAGDADDGEKTMASLRALSGLDTVAVAGNHDFYGADYFERLAHLRISAKEHGIHFLENDAVVLHGVRFIGATLWTDYCASNETLMHYGLWGMNDHNYILAASWWTAANKKRFSDTFGQHALEKFEGHFNPLLQIELHHETKRYLAKKAREVFAGPTVVVTHHAPTQQSLLKAGVQDFALEPTNWSRRRSDDLNLARVGSYASPLIERDVLDTKKEKSGFETRTTVKDLAASVWVHGHLHHAMDYGIEGLRILCNPRGRVSPAMTKESADAFSFFGYRVTDEQIAASQKHRAENPEEGDGQGYEKTKVIDLLDTCYHWVQKSHEDLMSDLKAMMEETGVIMPLANSSRQDIANLAAFRLDTLRQRALDKTKDFLKDMLRQHARHKNHERDLNWLLNDAKLQKWDNSFMVENVVNFEGLLDWFDRDPVEIKQRPPKYVKEFRAELRQLIRTLEKVPKGCEMLRKNFNDY